MFIYLYNKYPSLQSCPASVPSFFRYSAFFFFFSFLQCFWPCLFFFVQWPMLSWKSYNQNRFGKPTRCHPFSSFLQQPFRHYLHGCHSFCNTLVNAAQKMIIMNKLSRRCFIEAATAAKTVWWPQGRSFKRWGKRRIHGKICYRADCRTECTVLFRFYQVLLPWLNPINPIQGRLFWSSGGQGGGGGGTKCPLVKTLFPFSETTQLIFFWKLVQNWVLWSKLGFHGNHGYGFKVVHIFQIFD